MKKVKFIASILILSVVLLLCFAAPIINGIDPNAQNIELRNDEPTLEHWFGTDSLGRDIFMRVCAGGRVSLLVAFACTILATTFGCLYGGISAFFPHVDRPMMSFLDSFSSIPDVLLIIVLSLWLNPKSVVVLAFSISLVGWCKTARLVRNLLKPLRSANYIVEARSLGKNGLYNVCFHMLPNISTSITSRAILSIPEFIFYESFLSYLGIGIRPPDASWGSLISEAQTNFMFHPYQLVVSSLFLILVLLSVSWLGDNISFGETSHNLHSTTTFLNTKENQQSLGSHGGKEIENCILSVQNLSVRYPSINRVRCKKLAVNCVDFSIRQGEIVGLVGESGCGKTTIARAIAGIIYLYHGAISSESRFTFDGKPVDYCSKTDLQRIYGKNGIAVIYQDALSCLDPTAKIGKQLIECLLLQGAYSKAESQKMLEKYLCDVGLGGSIHMLLDLYPYQLSGGIAQRIMIAMSIMTKPKLLICDEPTASLDYINRKKIVMLIKELADKYSIAVLFITHDISIVKEIASKILVMNRGSIVDSITPEDFGHSKNIYTKQLAEATLKKKTECVDFHTAITVLRGIHLYYRYPTALFDSVENISFKLKQGEIFGILGESGSGKTTLAKIILGQLDATQGRVQKDSSIQNIQYLFQNPRTAFDPHWTVGRSILEGIPNCKGREALLDSLFEQVGLENNLADRYPSELSLGQCQRAAIARAVAVNPQLVICDEPTSALDLVNQKRILELLMQLNSERKRTYIFISHDLEVINYISDRIAVMYRGKFVEVASADDFFDHVYHPYAQVLITGTISSAPATELDLQYDGVGCDYYPYCSKRTDICKYKAPELKKIGCTTSAQRHHFVACHNAK